MKLHAGEMLGLGYRLEIRARCMIRVPGHVAQDAAREDRRPEVQIEAEEALQNDAPDICLVRQTDFLQQICQTTLCKSG